MLDLSSSHDLGDVLAKDNSKSDSTLDALISLFSITPDRYPLLPTDMLSSMLSTCTKLDLDERVLLIAKELLPRPESTPADWIMCAQSRVQMKQDSHVAVQECNEAIRRLTSSSQGEHQLALAFVVRGRAYTNVGLYDRAVTDLDLALGMEPNNFPALSARGIAFREMRRFSEAVEDYNKIISGTSSATMKRQILANRGLCYLAIRKYREAEADFDSVFGREDQHDLSFMPPPVVVEMRCARAWAVFNLGRYRDACGMFQHLWDVTRSHDELKDRDDVILGLGMSLRFLVVGSEQSEECFSAFSHALRESGVSYEWMARSSG